MAKEEQVKVRIKKLREYHIQQVSNYDLWNSKIALKSNEKIKKEINIKFQKEIEILF
ncbi:MAG: hypothetical protein AB8H03_07440 [Saprospiraceae bacterium]